MTKPKNLAGSAFGRLRVLHLDPCQPRRSWLCDCTCGKKKVVAQKELLRGDTKSCGCLKAERLSAHNKKGNVDHDKLTAEQRASYRKWAQMWQRVRNPVGKSECYVGVWVDDRWLDFMRFYEDMGAPPKGYSLDRIDNSLGYGPNNCRWVPLAKQAQNTRRNRNVEFNGIIACVSEHAKRVGLNPDVVFDRLNKLGWGIDRALSTPKRPCGRRRGTIPTRVQPRSKETNIADVTTALQGILPW